MNLWNRLWSGTRSSTPGTNNASTSPDSVSDRTREEFFQAIQKGKIRSIKKLLSKQPALLLLGHWKHGKQLHAAAETGRKDVVELLLAHGADVNVKDLHGETPLHKAVCGGHGQAVESLLAAKADINAEDSCKSTPLREAVTSKRPDMVSLLLAQGASVNVALQNGETPLAGADMPFSVCGPKLYSPEQRRLPQARSLRQPRESS